MKVRFLLAVAATLSVMSLVVVTSAGPVNAATQTFNVANDGVTCLTVTGKIVFAAGLHDAGAATPVVANVSGTVGGCYDRTNANVHMFKGTFKQTFTIPTTDCAPLFSQPFQVNLTAGTSTFTWTPAAGQDFSPKTIVGGVPKRITTGSPFAWGPLGTGDLGFGGSWNKLAIADTEAGMFLGTLQLPEGSYDTYLQQDTGNIFNQCASAAGLKSVSLGVGFFVSG